MKIQERGRSMVEMLGVLAVIGVLSVAGVAGFKTAMDKHKANELLHQVSMRATNCMAQIQLGNAPSVNDFGDYGDYTFSVNKTENSEQFTLQISGADVPDAVCDYIKNMAGSNMQINDTCDTITFNDDLSNIDGESGNSGNQGSSTPTLKHEGEECTNNNECESLFCYQGECALCVADENCGDCQICNAGHCESSCASGVACLTDSNTGNKVCCEGDAGEPLGNYCCKSIGGTQENPTCCRNANQTECCDADHPLARKNTGVCYSCDEASGIYLEGVSERCESICSGKRLWLDNQCRRCPQPGGNRNLGYGDFTQAQCAKCSDTMEWDVRANTCIFHLTCSGNTPLESLDGKNCYTCDDSSSISLGSALYRCEAVCPGKRISWDNRCRRCPQPGGLRTLGSGYRELTQDECENKCGDTMEWDAQAGSNGLCIFHPTCSGDTPLETLDGKNCYSCDKPENIHLGDVSYRCESVCAGKRLIFDGSCRRCPQPESGIPYFTGGYAKFSQATCAKCSETLEWNSQTGECVFHPWLINN